MVANQLKKKRESREGILWGVTRMGQACALVRDALSGSSRAKASPLQATLPEEKSPLDPPGVEKKDATLLRGARNGNPPLLMGTREEETVRRSGIKLHFANRESPNPGMGTVSDVEPEYSNSLIFLLAFLLCMVAFEALSAPIAEITLHETAAVQSKEILLGDIADVTGEQAGLMRNLLIQNAPPLGTRQTLRPNIVVSKLRQAGFDADRITIQGAQSVQLSSGGETISSQELSKVIQRAIEERLESLPGRSEVRVARAPSPICLRDRSVSWEVKTNSNDLFGTVSVQAIAKSLETGDTVATVRTTVQIQRYASALVASRDIPRGEFVAASDMRLAEREITNKYQLQDLITDQSQIVNMKMTRFVATGEPFLPSILEREKVVKSGDNVRIELERGALYIVAQGVAKQAGCIGDQIRVRSLAGERDMTAQVVDRGCVKIP